MLRREGAAQKPTDGEKKLVLEVSRTWIPHEVLGNFDRREMGIGIKIVNRK